MQCGYKNKIGGEVKRLSATQRAAVATEICFNVPGAGKRQLGRIIVFYSCI